MPCFLLAVVAAAPMVAAAQTADPFRVQPVLTGHAIFGCDAITISGGAVVQSQDLIDGAAGMEHGDLASNGKVTLSGGATVVHGDVRLGPAGTFSASGGSYATGTVTNVSPAFACSPIALSFIHSEAQAQNNNAQMPMTGYGKSAFKTSPTVGDFEVSGGDTLTIPAGTYYFSKMTVSGGSKITISGNVRIFLAGAAAVSGGSTITASPFSLLVFSDTTLKHALSGGSAQMVFYSPSSEVDLNFTYEGNIFAKKVVLSGGMVRRLIDSTVPSMSILTPADGSTQTTSSVTAHVTYSDPSPGSGLETSTFTAALDGADVSASFAVGGSEATANLQGLADGSHTLSVSIKDHSGNVGSAVAAFVVSTDTTPPNVTIVSPSTGGATRSPFAVSIDYSDAGSGVDLASVHVHLDNSEVTGQLLIGVSGSTGALQASEEAHTISVSLSDTAGNPASTSSSFSVDNTAPQVSISGVAEGAFVNTSVTLAVTMTDSNLDESQTSITLDGSPTSSPVMVSDDGLHSLAVRAIDRAGNTALLARSFTIDTQAPLVAIISPPDGSTVDDESITVSGTASDLNLESVTVNGVSASIAGSTFAADGVAVSSDPTPITATARDRAGNQGQASVSVRPPGPRIQITSPPNLSLFGLSPITVEGTVSDPLSTVLVNGAQATVTGTTFRADGLVPLREGSNLVTASATRNGRAATATITVALDTTAPTVLIQAPANGATVYEPTITVTGMINDIVTGTVNSPDATVTVNGVVAMVLNRSFLARDVPLSLGTDVLLAEARDAAGNASAHSIQVIRQDSLAARIMVLSGNNQQGRIRSTLPEPLAIALVDASGNPAVGVPVTFQVTRDDGSLQAGTQSGRSLAVTTDAAGHAQVSFTLGSRSGVGNERVRATAQGYAGQAVFTASAQPGPAQEIKVVGGDTQTGAVGQSLPEPFVVFVHDEGGNPVEGADVTFDAVSGGGNILGVPTRTVTTDNDGRASAILTLGPAPGRANNVVRASFTGMVGLPAFLQASGVTPGRPEDTTVSGVVVDNTNTPLEHVKISIDAFGMPDVFTDAQGQFRIPNAPVGAIHLEVHGATTTRPGNWPHLAFMMTTVPGIDNTLGMPIYLVPLDDGVEVGTTQDTIIEMKDVPGMSIRVAAGSTTFADGSHTGVVSLSQVHFDRVPMAPINGVAPPLTWTVQPAGARFDPPAQVTYPNVLELDPGAIVDIFSFDHDLEQFVSVGSGSVVEEADVVMSDPGVGIRKAGWGYVPPQPPPPTTCTQLDAPSLTVTPATACVLMGKTIDLTASAGTGCGPGSFDWSWDGDAVDVLPGQTTSTTSTVTVVPMKSGITTVTAQYCDSAGCSSADATLTVSRSFTFHVVNFIPCEVVQVPFFYCTYQNPPNPDIQRLLYADGDKRSFVFGSLAYRTRHLVDVVPVSDCDGTGSGFANPPDQRVGTSINFASNALSSLVSCGNNQSGVVTAAARADAVLGDCDLKHAQQMGVRGVDWSMNAQVTRIKASIISVDLLQSASNPLIYGACAIDYKLNLRLREDDDGTLTYQLSGTHDRFPAYEVYAEDDASGTVTTIYQYDPIPLGRTPFDLCGDQAVTPLENGVIPPP